MVDKKTKAISSSNDFKPLPTTVARSVPVIDKKNEHLFFLIILYRPKLTSYGIISHESLHISNFIADILGFSKSFDNDEPQAYLIQWIANCASSVLNNNPQKMNGVFYEEPSKKVSKKH